MTNTEKYNKIRDNLITGDIIIWSNRGILPSLIQKFSGKGSHCGTIIKMGNRVILFESTIKWFTQNGVEPVPASERLSESGDWCIRRDTIDRKGLEEKRCFEAWGKKKKYDLWGLAVQQPIFIMSGGKYFVRRFGIKDDQGFYCSEFCSWNKDMEGWETMTPHKLYIHKELTTILNFTN